MTDLSPTRRGVLIAGVEAAALAVLWKLPPPAAAATVAAAPGALRLRVFDYKGVRLLPSRWQTQQNDVLNYYMAVANDNYLVGFRRRAKQEDVPGTELGGWYAYKEDHFNPFGQIVSGLARFFAATGRPDVKDKVNALVAGFSECIGSDGYFFYSPENKAKHYSYDKILCGMLDAWLYCGDLVGRDSIAPISWWAFANLARTRPYGADHAEWYTLSENLYRTYLANNNTGYLDFGKEWEYRGYWDHFYHRDNWFIDPGTGKEVVNPYHAYSHVNTLSGLGAGYLATGGAYYREALANAHDIIRDSQAFATGGYGTYERFFKSRSSIGNLLRTPFTHSHFETQCGSWAVFKVAKYLLQITGDARFGDWAEHVLYNGVGGSMQSLADGRVQYFSDYSSRGGTKFAENAWSCCAGTKPQVVADYTDMVFLNAPGELCVNLFLPASVDWPSPGGRVRARLETSFPESDTLRLTIDEAPGTALTVKFRAPSWLVGAPGAKVNGTAVAVAADSLHWLPISRTWRAGDVLELTLPTGDRPRLQRFDQDAEYPVALVQGPVVLPYKATANPVRQTSAQAIVASLQRVSGTLDYRIAGQTVVKPYYSYAPGERYFLHLDPKAGPFVSFQGTWDHNTIWLYSRAKVANEAAEAEFEGTGIRWRWRQFDDAGIARVEIDGQVVATVDQFNPANDPVNDPWRVGTAAVAQFTGLAAGRHRIKVICTGTKNGSSRGSHVSLHDVEYLDADAWKYAGYTGPWNFNVSLSYTRTANASAEIGFDGTGIRWRWQKFNDAGIARVEIDGQVVRTVDQYDPQRDVPAVTDVTGLAAGRHRIRIVNSGTKNPSSSNTYINVEKFEPLP